MGANTALWVLVAGLLAGIVVTLVGVVALGFRVEAAKQRQAVPVPLREQWQA